MKEKQLNIVNLKYKRFEICTCVQYNMSWRCVTMRRLMLDTYAIEKNFLKEK